MQRIVVEPHPGYQAALDYMYSFINYEDKMPSSAEHVQLNHARMLWLLRELDQPQEKYPSVVIAGTKGKGSTAAMIESILRAAGKRTGFYSSPHLHSWRERIQVNRELIPQAQVVRLMDRLRELVERLPADLGPPTTFEIATGIALRYFAEQQVDVAVLEIGLGGRNDSVNVVTPRVSVITPISYDHVAVLGPTLTDIAGAKAGIIKSGVPVIFGPQEPEALAVIQREAGVDAPLWQAEVGGIRRLQDGGDEYQDYPIPVTPDAIALRGPHQAENARLAVGAVMLFDAQELRVEARAFEVGLRSVQWPARFEVVEGRPTVVIDGAMNAASAVRLRAALATIPHERLVLILGTSRDKDLRALAAELVPEASAVLVTRSRHPRSAGTEALAAAVEPFLRGPLIITDDIPPALDKAREIAGPNDLICVAGSLFVAAAAREALGLAEVID